VLRLSRVRKNDPTLRLEEIELKEAQRLGSGQQGTLCECIGSVFYKAKYVFVGAWSDGEA
jgi:hypothetical protein